MIFCWSVHHMATWTTLKWLESYHEINAVAELRFLESILLEGQYNYMTVQQYARERTVFHDHFVRGSKDYGQLDPGALALALTSPHLVIPLRDPLATCLTAQRRTELNAQKGFDGLAAIEEMKLLARAWPILVACRERTPLCLPWDIVPVQERESWLKGSARILGLDDPQATFTWAQRWPIKNTKGDYAYKQAYAQRDLSWLEKQLPKVLTGLRGLEDSLRPWLETQGYKRLLWWS